MENTKTITKYYTCKRMRMLSWLVKRGFMPFETVPDVNNPRYNNWLFEKTPEFELAASEYFRQLVNNQ